MVLPQVLEEGQGDAGEGAARAGSRRAGRQAQALDTPLLVRPLRGMCVWRLLVGCPCLWAQLPVMCAMSVGSLGILRAHW